MSAFGRTILRIGRRSERVGRGGDVRLGQVPSHNYWVGLRLSKQLRQFGAVRRKALSRFDEF